MTEFANISIDCILRVDMKVLTSASGSMRLIEIYSSVLQRIPCQGRGKFDLALVLRCAPADGAWVAVSVKKYWCSCWDKRQSVLIDESEINCWQLIVDESSEIDGLGEGEHRFRVVNLPWYVVEIYLIPQRSKAIGGIEQKTIVSAINVSIKREWRRVKSNVAAISWRYRRVLTDDTTSTVRKAKR